MIMDDNSAAPHQACASCKHQRRKCQTDCPLAPFFPPEKNHQFQAVQKVFGVSNVTKVIKSLQTREQKRRAIDTMSWEAQWRLKNPEEGCYREVRRLSDEVRRLSGELELYKKAFERQAYNASAPAGANGYGGSVLARPHDVMNIYGVINDKGGVMNNCGGRVGVQIASNNNNNDCNINVMHSNTNIMNPDGFGYGFVNNGHLVASDPAVFTENAPDGNGNRQTHNQPSSCSF